MNPYLSPTEIWVEPTPLVVNLHNKVVLILVGESMRRARIAVTQADPQSPAVRKVAVAECHLGDDQAEWASGPMILPAGTISDTYLGEAAFSLFCATDLARRYGCDLQFTMPSTAE